MPDSSEANDRWSTVFFVSGIAVLAVGFALTFFGVGADLRASFPVEVVVVAPDVPPRVAESVKAGDAVFTDPAGMEIGRIADVRVSAQTTQTVDASGAVRLVEVPGLDQVELTIEGQGRRSGGVTVLDTQVLSVGQRFVVYTRDAFLEANVMSFRAK